MNPTDEVLASCKRTLCVWLCGVGVGLTWATVAWAQAPVYPPKAAWGEPISLQLEGVPVRLALQSIAEMAGINLVVSDQVSGSVSLQLEDVAWPDALEVIAVTSGIRVQRQGDVYWVTPRAAEAKQSVGPSTSQPLGGGSELAAAPVLLTPPQKVVSRVFRLNYAKAVDLLQQLQGVSRGAAARRASGLLNAAATKPSDVQPPAMALPDSTPSMWADGRSNQLFVVDTESNVARIEQWIAALDVPVKQVVIEARIVEADQNFSRQLGVRLGSAGAQPVTWGNHIGVGPTYEAVAGLSGSAALPFVSLPAAGVNGYAAATFAVSLFGSGVSRFLNLEISALEADGKGKVISSPHVVTTDRVTATIQQGTEYPYQTVSANGQTSVEFRRASLKLEVTPRITPNGYVLLSLVVHKDSRGETTASGIAINTKQVQTEVLVEDGGTLVIGGILEEYERADVTQVPVLGEIPVIGNVFKSTSKRVDKTEVVVFITPRVLDHP